MRDTKEEVVAALRAGGGLVDFVVYGNVEVSVAVSPGVPLIFRSEEVEHDERDTGDLEEPFRPYETHNYETVL
ncbi:hypothetical protein [Conyzicola nivalis]|uniref:hypothetical protein n=1 Tax=Conyzicola nivalis TaxID=1477021 RepID=UPI00166780E1|nr:hypothetical protein [Conyzicola nivalis]